MQIFMKQTDFCEGCRFLWCLGCFECMGVKLDFSLLLFMCIFSVNACMLWSFIISRFPHQGSLVSLSFQGLNGALLMGKRYSTVFGGKSKRNGI